MLKEIEQLLVLQDRDRKLRTLRQELKNAPLERKQLEEKLAAAKKNADATKLKGKELEVERKSLEVEAQAKRDQIAKYNVQKFQTRKNEEYRALTNEIERFEREIQAIEDKELDLMEQSEQLKPHIAEAEKAAQAATESVERLLKDLEARIKALEEQIISVEGDRGKLATDVDEDLLDTYQRLFSTKGDAVVALENEVCTGCHMKVTASTKARARAEKELVNCDQCGRILYAER